MLKIVEYPHPALRHESKPLKRVDAELHTIVREMFDSMYEARGIGLAANQVDLPYRLFVVNLTADPDCADAEQVFINPVISNRHGAAEAEEGCLSFPGLQGDVRRPEKVSIAAYNLSGEPISGDLSGMAARVVQHETDHLDGVLFIDKLSSTGQLEARDAIAQFERRYAHHRQRGDIPDDATILARLEEMERLRC